jgi:hypothetical protein
VITESSKKPAKKESKPLSSSKNEKDRGNKLANIFDNIQNPATDSPKKSKSDSAKKSKSDSAKKGN